MVISFRSTPETMRLALVFMIGQMEVMGLTVTTADVAAFCDCTKITARKHLRILEKQRRILASKVQHRPKVMKDVWLLSDRSRQERDLFAAYENAYRLLMAQKVENSGY